MPMYYLYNTSDEYDAKNIFLSNLNKRIYEVYESLIGPCTIPYSGYVSRV